MSIMSINQFEWSEHEISQMKDVIKECEWTFNTDKLLKKEDQCSLVCQCTHLFWTGNGPNGEPPRNGQDDMVLQCLKRS